MLLYVISLIISPACVGLIATLTSAPALMVLACAGTLGTAVVAAAPAARAPRPVLRMPDRKPRLRCARAAR